MSTLVVVQPDGVVSTLVVVQPDESLGIPYHLAFLYGDGSALALSYGEAARALAEGRAIEQPCPYYPRDFTVWVGSDLHRQGHCPIREIDCNGNAL